MLNGRIAPGLYAPRGAWYTLPYKSPYAVSRVTRALMRRTGRYFGLQLALDYLHVEANAFDHTQSCAISAVHISADNRFLFLSRLAQHAEQNLRNGRIGRVLFSHSGVRLSVCPIIRSPQSAAAGLLLCARRGGNIDRLLHGRRSAPAAPQHGV